MIERRVGRGGQANVYKARYNAEDDKETVAAIKIFTDSEQDSALSALEREATALKSLRGKPNIIQLLREEDNAQLCANDRTKQVCFLALEYVPDSLEQAIHNASGADGALSELQCWQYFKQLMQAVKDIHGSEELYNDTGFIGRAHRDLKPQNILITEE